MRENPEEQIVQVLASYGYESVVLLDGVLCGLEQYLFTTAIVVDIKTNGYGRRYCFTNKSDAVAALSDWDGVEHPSGNWIKCKGTFQGEVIDLINPNFNKV